MWTGKKPNIGHLQEFGTEVWVLTKGAHDKMKPRAHKYIFTGFEDGPKAIRYYDANTRKIKISQNFTFRDTNNSEILIQLPNKGESGGDTPICQFDHGAGMDTETEKRDNQSPDTEMEKWDD